MDGQGNVYVADTWNQRIQKLDQTGRQLAQYPVAAWSNQAITNKPYLSVDPTGRIYATVPEDWPGLPAREALGDTFARLPLFRRS